MTLAEYMAVIWIINQEKAAGLAPMLGLIPEYARRGGYTIESIWAMPAENAIDQLIGMIPSVVTLDAAKQAQETSIKLAAIIDPKKITAAVTAALSP